MGWEETAVKDIAVKLAKLEKKNDKPRMVVFTQGSECTVVATPDGAKEYAVGKVKFPQHRPI